MAVHGTFVQQEVLLKWEMAAPPFVERHRMRVKKFEENVSTAELLIYLGQ